MTTFADLRKTLSYWLSYVKEYRDGEAWYIDRNT